MAQRLALIVGNSEYDDAGLARLVTPDADVQVLAGLLRAPEIGGFDEVTTLVNQPANTIRRAIARFFREKKRDDLLLLYFSGHGVLDDRGHLYLAVADTERDLPNATAVPAAFITDEMDRSQSRRQVLILDCCHSGAFARGAKGAPGASVGTAAAFEGSGTGRVVLTATDATQYAFEGDRVVGQAECSVFTHHLVDGLANGAADADGDGRITLDELYDHVYARVVDETPRQTPGKWSFKQQGEIIIARNPRPVVQPAELPAELRQAIESPFASVREGAVTELARLLAGSQRALAQAARAALEQLAQDDSRRVSSAALAQLAAPGLEQEGRVAPPADVERRPAPLASAASPARPAQQEGPGPAATPVAADPTAAPATAAHPSAAGMVEPPPGETGPQVPAPSGGRHRIRMLGSALVGLLLIGGLAIAPRLQPPPEPSPTTTPGRTTTAAPSAPTTAAAAQPSATLGPSGGGPVPSAAPSRPPTIAAASSPTPAATTLTPYPTSPATIPARAPATLTPIPTQRIVVSDDFGGSTAGLLSKSSSNPKDYELGYDKGEYFIRNINPTYPLMPAVWLSDRFANIAIIVDARVVDDASGRYVTVGCHDQRTAAGASGYRLAIEPSKRSFSITRWDNGKEITLVGWRTSDRILPNNERNRLQLVCARGTIAASINGAEVASVPDTTYGEGYVWIGAAIFPAQQPGTVEARFDNLIVVGQ